MFRRRGDRRAGNGDRSIQVECSDSRQYQFTLEKRLTGSGLLESVCHSLGINEVGFFGLVYKRVEDSQDIWLDANKLVRKQITGVPPYLLRLRVKVYPINSKAVEEATRNYLYLQVKSDIQAGRLRCENPASFSKIIAFMAQVELGDFNSSTSLSLLMLPNLNIQLLSQISEVYSQLKGKTAMMCKEEFLALAQQEDTYGMVIYQVLDATRRPVNLGLAPSGIRVMHGTIPRAIYQWDSIIKIYTKHKSVNLKTCSLHTQHTQRVKFHCSHLHDTKSLAKTIAELVGYYREYHTSTPETLPRLKRWFTGRHSSHRIQRSVSMRVPSSARSQPPSSGIRSFATQSFSGADKIKVDRVSQDRATAPIVVTTKRSASVSSPPAVNGRLLHETGQTLDEPPYFESKRSSRHSGQGGFPDQDRFGVQLLHLKDSPVSADRLTQGTETSCDETSRESTPHCPPRNITMETAQLEAFSRSPDIYPHNSTPKQDVHAQQNGFHHQSQAFSRSSDIHPHNSTPKQDVHAQQNGFHHQSPEGSCTTQTTPLHSIPERTKTHHFTMSDRPELKSRSSPMLRGTRFSSESSIQRQLRTMTHSPESSSIIYRSKRGRASVTSEVTNSLLLNRSNNAMLPEVPCDEAYMDSHIRSILFDTSQREETSTEF